MNLSSVVILRFGHFVWDDQCSHKCWVEKLKSCLRWGVCWIWFLLCMGVGCRVQCNNMCAHVLFLYICLNCSKTFEYKMWSVAAQTISCIFLQVAECWAWPRLNQVQMASGKSLRFPAILVSCFFFLQSSNLSHLLPSALLPALHPSSSLVVFKTNALQIFWSERKSSCDSD